MKALIASTASAVLAICLPAFANAQDTAPNSGTSFYGSLGYAGTNVSGVDLGAIQGRLGARFGTYWGVEGELAGGVKNDKTTVGGVPVKVDLEHQAAIYGVGYLPVGSNFDVLARVGYGNSKIKASGGGASATADGDSWNYGVGAQYHLDDKNALRADYTRHDFRGSNSDSADVWSIAYARKF